MGYVRTEHFECEICALGTGPLDNDVPDEDEDEGDPADPRIPPGWVIGRFTRVVPNPKHAEEQAARVAIIDAQLQDTLQVISAEESAQQPTLEQVQHMRASVARQLDIDSPASETTHVVEETAIVLCHEHANLPTEALKFQYGTGDVPE